MIINNATIINEGERFTGSLLIKDGKIVQIERGKAIIIEGEETLDAEGHFLLPGIIDDHVHMREPGLTHKGNMDTETRAAVAGGVTTVLDMPNVVPQTTSLSLLKERYDLATKKCHANYGFFLGATSQNIEDIENVDTHLVPGVKLFMGSSTGNMLVDDEIRLKEIFQKCPTLLMTHCEDTKRINENMQKIQADKGEDPNVIYHPVIRDEEACFQSTSLAVRLAKETGARLHVAHLTTARELELFTPYNKQITAEACVAHLLYTDSDYSTLGTRIKCNPAIKSQADRDALRHALNDGRITIIGTDHAPHLLSEKEGGAKKAVSGMPMVQFSLPSMLTLTDQGILSIERMVELMCHNPAKLFKIDKRGFIRLGYHADLVLVRPNMPWLITPECIQSLCGWSPREGDTLNWRVERTWVNGNLVWDGKDVNTNVLGEAIRIS